MKRFTQSVYTLINSSNNNSYKHYLMAAIFVTFFKSYRFFQFGNDYLSRCFRTLLNDKRDNIPTLLLYSKSDDLVDAREIEKFIEQRKRKVPNLKIISVVFKIESYSLTL